MWAWVLLGVVTCAAGCGTNSTCNLVTIIPPIIAVQDASSGATLCDAVVVASGPAEHAITTTLRSETPTGSTDAQCTYVGISTIGTYSISVSKDGFQTTTVPNVVVQAHSCNEPGAAPSAQVVKVDLARL